MLGSLQSYCLPWFARFEDPLHRNGAIGRVLLIVCLASGVVLAAVCLTKTWLIEILYSPLFRHAAVYLRWTLLGDYLKVSSWVLSVALLASGDVWRFLIGDLIAYGAFLASHAMLADSRSVPGILTSGEAAGAAFVIMYAAHFLYCCIVLTQRHQLALSRTVHLSWLAGAACLLICSYFAWNQV